MISEEAKRQIKQNKKNYVKYVDIDNVDYALKRREYQMNMEKLPMAEGTMWRKDCLNGIPVEWISASENSKKIILYVHGGAFVIGSPVSSRYMVSHIASLSNRNAVSVDYRLAPEYPYPAALEDCIAVYQWLLQNGFSTSDIVFLGESAGGTLILAMLSYCKLHQIPFPKAACVIAPSTDHTFSSDSYIRNAETEMIVELNAREQVKRVYFKDADPKDPVVSPYYADVAGWPPIYFQADSSEILYDETIKMHQKLLEAGVESELFVTNELFHTYQMLPLPESEKAHRMIADFFKEHE